MNLNEYEISGRVVAVKGPGIVAALPYVQIGAICEIAVDRPNPVLARVVGFEEDRVALAPFDVMTGVAAGQKVRVIPNGLTLNRAALIPGNIVNCFGAPLCQYSATASNPHVAWEVRRAPPDPLTRLVISKQLVTGIHTIDTLLPLGEGQRVGLFAGAGAGKSTLLGMLASAADVDVVVVGLIGERGRELGEFISDNLSAAARERTTVVVATSDESAARRYLAAETATAIAEYHRSCGKRVLLLMDSLTRVARALREMSLAAGELPVRQGYTASVYSELPILLERSGNDDRGSISALYTVLMNGDNDADPLAEEIKSLLDGHIVLHPSIAARGLRPAIDLSQSVSRVASRVVAKEETAFMTKITAAFSRLKRDRDVVTFGGQPDPELSRLLAHEPQMIRLLTQSDAAATLTDAKSSASHRRRELIRLIEGA